MVPRRSSSGNWPGSPKETFGILVTSGLHSSEFHGVLNEPSQFLTWRSCFGRHKWRSSYAHRGRKVSTGQNCPRYCHKLWSARSYTCPGLWWVKHKRRNWWDKTCKGIWCKLRSSFSAKLLSFCNGWGSNSWVLSRGVETPYWITKHLLILLHSWRMRAQYRFWFITSLESLLAWT